MTDRVAPSDGAVVDVSAPAAPTRPARAAGMAWPVTVLTVIGFLASVDRQVFTTLLVPIQKDLHVSDAAMGLLTGSAFAIIYALIALPLARLADTRNRRNIIAIAVAIWSAATAFCGLASGYFTLLAARLGVASAEAANLPATLSMMGDMAPASRRGTPLGVWNGGIALGFASGALIAGVLNDHFGWHAAMMIVGIPGLIVAAVMYLTVREPVRGVHDNMTEPAVREPLIQSLRRIAGIKTLRPFVIGYIGLNICYTGWLVWLPPFLMRVHHLSATKMGAVFFAIVIGGMLSTVVAGPISDRLARRSPRWRLYFACATSAISVPLLAASTLVPGLQATVAILIAYTLVSGSISSNSQTIYLSLAPVNMRGLVVALMNIIGLGFGAGLAPVIYGAVNDVLKQTYGDQSLRYTLLIAPATMAFCCVMYLVASRTMDRDVANVGNAAADPASPPAR